MFRLQNVVRISEQFNGLRNVVLVSEFDTLVIKKCENINVKTVDLWRIVTSLK